MRPLAEMSAQANKDHPVDYFALLGQPRRPWLDLDELKNQFRARAAEQHPDGHAATDASQFGALNTAYSTLRDPARRLSHLLALEAPEVPLNSSRVAPELEELFMTLAARKQRMRESHDRAVRGQSQIARAMHAEEDAALQRAARESLQTLEDHYSRALEDLRTLDALWHPCDAELAERAAKLQNRFVYLARWIADFREMLLQYEIDA